VLPGDTGTVDGHGNLLIDLDQGDRPWRS
jgi:hypothetical protein